jgi:hypothetical protein
MEGPLLPITLATFYNEFVDNPSVSPDGQYVVFERRTTGIAPIQYDLWIVNRSNPVEMWPLTSDGQSMNPDWSRVNPGETPCTAVTGVRIDGPTRGFTDTPYAFTAVITPSNASPPIIYTWSPAPSGGQGTATASYAWGSVGSKTLTATIEHCGSVAKQAVHTITLNAAQRIYLPLTLRDR